jgi:hypothetical protein
VLSGHLAHTNSLLAQAEAKLRKYEQTPSADAEPSMTPASTPRATPLDTPTAE